ncbi:MAG: GAF domain-containing protein [Candidatus Methylomirabilis oxyfera]|nr:GAF domain-containing protein [Candidatus Methylomirabilis oxyfera]
MSHLGLDKGMEGQAVAAERPEGFFIIDRTQRIVQWSDGAEALIGLPGERVLGYPCYEAVQRQKSCGNTCRPSCSALRALEQGHFTGRSLLLIQRHSHALQLKCELTALPSPPGGAVIRLAPASRPRHITRGPGQIAALPPPGLSPDLVRDLHALVMLTTSLPATPTERSLGLALEILRETTGAEAAEVFLAEPGGRGMVLTGHSGLFRNAFFQITRFGPSEGFPGLVLTTQQPVMTTALSEDARYLRKRVVDRGFRSCVSVPFFDPNGLMGSLNLAFRRPDPDLEGAHRLLSWTGSTLGLMLQARTTPIREESSTPEAGGFGGESPQARTTRIREESSTPEAGGLGGASPQARTTPVREESSTPEAGGFWGESPQARTTRIREESSTPEAGGFGGASPQAGAIPILKEFGTAEYDNDEDQREGLDGPLRRVLQHVVKAGQAQGGRILALNRPSGSLLRHVGEGTMAEAFCPVIEATAPGNCPALSESRGIVLYGSRRSWPLDCRQASHCGEVTYCLPMIPGREAVGIMRISYQKPGPTPPTQHLVKLLGLADVAGWTILRVAASIRERQRIEGLHRQWLQLGAGAAGQPEHLAARGIQPKAPAPAIAAESPYLDIRCFGRFELYRQETLITPKMTPRRKALTLFKILLTHEGRPVSKDTLIELLWPEVAPEIGVSRLYMVVHALRRLVEPPGHERNWVFIRMDADSYYLDMSAACRVDVKEFEEMVGLGKRAEATGNMEAATDAYEAAVKLYRGDLLEDEPYAEWCWSEREYLRETCLDVLANLAAHYRQVGATERCIARYRQALRLDPAREQNHQGLMRALFALGRRDEALRQYQACREVLRRELDVTPLPETERLYLQIKSST